MNKPEWLKNQNFSPVIKLPKSFYVHDFSHGEDLNPTDVPYSVGRYNEDRKNMYTSDLFSGDCRTIHMGIDIAAPVGEEVLSFADGEIFLVANNKAEGDYGPTIITRHKFQDQKLYALYGHLNLESLEKVQVGQIIKNGEKIGCVGSRNVNGGWFPHVHFQLSLIEPKVADMPGVVSSVNHQKSLEIYPDPRWVLGPLY